MVELTVVKAENGSVESMSSRGGGWWGELSQVVTLTPFTHPLTHQFKFEHLPYAYMLYLIVAGGQSQATMEDFSSLLLEVVQYLSPNSKMVYMRIWFVGAIFIQSLEAS